ncbi:MAG: error-prone DNA polymerase [Xanthobacteraceae bacterium]|jgi:error-prone DNA polymerase
MYFEFAVASNFSFLRGASHPEELMLQAAHIGLEGIGLCDRNSVAGVVRAHLIKREKELILAYHPGARLVFADGTPDILAYPRNRQGWGRLCRLLTRGNLRAKKGECILYLDDLLEHIEGLELIVMERSTWELPSPPFLRSSRLNRQSLGCHAPLQAGHPVIPTRRVEAKPCQTRLSVVTGSSACADNDDREAAVPRFRLVATRKQGSGARDRELLSALRAAAPGRVRLAATMLYRGNDRARLMQRALIAAQAGVALIAVNDALYHHPERRQLQDVLTCIREHLTIDRAGRRLAANAERYLKPPAEMMRLFSDMPQAIEQTLALHSTLTFSLDELRHEYPDESRGGFASPQEALVHLTWEGAATRYPEGVPDNVRQALEHELELIGNLDYAPYFLTVHSIVRYARRQNILCQGRGSAANSAVCYCLHITDVDPCDGRLLFERFISSDRGEPPDIDVDFEHERREEVIQHIYRHYGRDHTGIAATVISYRGRSAIREVGKVFGLSEDTIAALASSIWGMGGGAVRASELKRAGINLQSSRMQKMQSLALEIQSFPRHLSQHVGGFVITRSPLDEVVPIANGAMQDRTFVEWDKDDLDALGILKVDVLGLGMLTCLRKAFELTEKHYGVFFRALRNEAPTGADASQVSPESLQEDEKRSAEKGFFTLAAVPKEEHAVYRMLQRADSVGVFQVESRAQMSMLPRLKPKEFYDLVIEVAIVRPGPIQGDMVHPYLRRRQGLEPISYPSEELETVLGKTLGVPLFQEQAMKIAIVAGGFTPGEADKLRRAMATFKRTGTIGTFKTKMIEGMVERNYPREFAERCFSQIEGFGEYGFPESHAASFALLVYASAWLKCRYPDVFAAALLNSQPMGFYAPSQIVRDVREHGVEVRPIDINYSEWDATLEPGPKPGSRVHALHGDMAHDMCSTHALRLGFRKIKGFSEQDAALIVAARRGEPAAKELPYASVRDLWLRTGLSPRILERLADADAFGSIGLTRRQALWAAKALGRVGDKEDDLPLFRMNGTGVRPNSLGLSTPEQKQEFQELGQQSSYRSEPEVALPPMPLGEEVVNDYRSLELSLRAHPASFLRSDLIARGVICNDELRARRSGERVTVSGLVTIRQRPGTANGVIFMTIEDETAVANIIVWPKTFERFRVAILGARYIAVTGELQQESGVIHVVAAKLHDLTALLARLAENAPPIESLARADALKRPHDENIDSRARGRRNPPRIAPMAEPPDLLASDLDVPARGSAHAPARRRASKQLT